ncbi:MAG: hypothetical protein ACAH10_03935 [Methylophilaceae bacterium]
MISKDLNTTNQANSCNCLLHTIPKEIPHEPAEPEVPSLPTEPDEPDFGEPVAAYYFMFN